jgi:hypothetical protein
MLNFSHSFVALFITFHEIILIVVLFGIFVFNTPVSKMRHSYISYNILAPEITSSVSLKYISGMFFVIHFCSNNFAFTFKYQTKRNVVL